MLYLQCSVALWHQSVTQLAGVRDRRCRHSFQNITAPSYCHQIPFFSDIFSLKYVSDFIGSASWTGHPKLLCCSAADQLQRQMCSHCFRATHAQNFFFFTNAQKLLGLNFHQRVPAGLYIPAQLLRAQSHSSPCAAS